MLEVASQVAGCSAVAIRFACRLPRFQAGNGRFKGFQTLFVRRNGHRCFLSRNSTVTISSVSHYTVRFGYRAGRPAYAALLYGSRRWVLFVIRSPLSSFTTPIGNRRTSRGEDEQRLKACCGTLDLTDYADAWDSLPPLKPLSAIDADDPNADAAATALVAPVPN